MNVIDLLVIGVILFTVFTTTRKGFVRVVAEILGFAAATWIAYYWFMDLGELIAPLLHLQARILYTLSFTVIWIVAFALFVILGRIVQKTINYTFLRPLNILASIVLGLLKGSLYAFLLLIVPLLMVSFLFPPLGSYIDQSFTMQRIKPFAEHIGNRITSEAMPNILELDETLQVIDEPPAAGDTATITPRHDRQRR